MNNKKSPSRVHYFEQQYLRRQEFADEQAYQIALRRRHNNGHHRWGIVVGLEVTQEEGTLVVRPGMAIDGYGRELVLEAKRSISAEEFPRLGSNRLDVWLYYELVEGAGAPVSYLPCGDDRSDDYYRSDESPRLVLERAGVSRINARRPKHVPVAVLDAVAPLETPDDPLVVWPVYLGRVTYAPEEQDPEKRFLIDASDRPYVGLLAEVIDHPANATRVEVGRASTQDEQRQVNETMYVYKATGDRAFAVFVPPQDVESDRVDLRPRFEIDVKDNNYLRGETTVYGNLQIAGGAVQFTKPAQVDSNDNRDYPSIYRVASNGNDELRFDLGKVAVPPPQQPRVFTIGITTDDGLFRPSLKLEYLVPAGASEPQPLLTVYGDLTVNGLLNSPDIIARSLSTETLNALLSSFQAGVIAAGGK
ncbi:hypothetical protein [Nitrospira sp. Nam80]